MGFQGVFHNSLDPKGRASIPARFREVLGSVFGDDTLVVTQEKGGVVAYPSSSWKKIAERISELPPGQLKEDLYVTTVSPAVECPFDKQGRILLPQSLREYADLDQENGREVVVVGVANKILLWNRAKYAEMRRRAEERVAEEPQKLFELGL